MPPPPVIEEGALEAHTWEALFEARIAALPAEEEKYGWYSKVQSMVEMQKSAQGDGPAVDDTGLYDKVKETLTGGKGHAAVVDQFSARSKQIGAAVKTAANMLDVTQKLEMQSLTLDNLLAAAEEALPVYGQLLQSVAEDISKMHPVEFLKCPKVKAKARAANKVTIKYGGDCRHVKDLVRGTFIFDTLEGMYAGIEALVYHPLFNGYAQSIADFDDRWQEPLSGGYSDCQLLVRIMGHLCELQVCVCVREARSFYSVGKRGRREGVGRSLASRACAVQLSRARAAHPQPRAALAPPPRRSTSAR